MALCERNNGLPNSINSQTPGAALMLHAHLMLQHEVITKRKAPGDVAGINVAIGKVHGAYLQFSPCDCAFFSSYHQFSPSFIYPNLNLTWPRRHYFMIAQVKASLLRTRRSVSTHACKEAALWLNKLPTLQKVTLLFDFHYLILQQMCAKTTFHRPSSPPHGNMNAQKIRHWSKS